MSARGELVSFSSPLEKARAALRGDYSVLGAGQGADLEVRDVREKLVCRVRVKPAPGGSIWLTLRPLRGYDRDAERIRRRLQAGGFLSEAGWKSPRVPMTVDERADVVAARVLRRLLEIQDANLPGVLADADVAFLHDYRVAVRRSRAVVHELRGVFAPEDLERVRPSLRWLQEQTSATRDIDVYLEDFERLRALTPDAMRADLEPLERLLRRRRRHARAAMERSLSSARARELRAEWGDILELLVLQPQDQRPDAARPIGELAGARIRREHRRMVRMGREITRASPPEQYHELRKRGKELRYLLQLFGAPLFDHELVDPLARALEGLQDVLGVHQDREVQLAMLHEIAQELVSEPGGAGALMAIGTLIERLERDAQAARARFAASFAGFASRSQCKLVANAFR